MSQNYNTTLKVGDRVKIRRDSHLFCMHLDDVGTIYLIYHPCNMYTGTVRVNFPPSIDIVDTFFAGSLELAVEREMMFDEPE